MNADTPWLRHLHTWTRSQAPASLASAEVRAFLTSLAVDRKGSASTQNLACTARLCFYRPVLNQALGTVEGVVRATRTPDVPVVFARAEIATMLQYWPPPYALGVKRLWGCGRRLVEGVPRRVPCLNVEAGVFTMHDGTGGNDRTVPLPEPMLPALRAPRDSWNDLHPRDLERDSAGVLLVNTLEKT